MSTRGIIGVVAAVILGLGLYGLLTSPATAFGFSCPSIADNLLTGSGRCGEATSAREKWAWPLAITGAVLLIGVGIGSRSERTTTIRETRSYRRGIEVIDVSGSDWLKEHSNPDEEVVKRHEERKRRNLGTRPPTPPDPPQ